MKSAERRHALQGRAEEDTRLRRRTSWPTSTYALQQVVQHGTGTEAQELGRPAAGKTGTAASTGHQTSAWFVGYTPQLCAAVDFYKGTGRADLDGVGGLPTFFGGEYPARIWTAFMTGGDGGQGGRGLPGAAPTSARP